MSDAEIDKLWRHLEAAKAVILLARSLNVHGQFCRYLEGECTCGKEKLDRMIAELPFDLRDR